MQDLHKKGELPDVLGEPEQYFRKMVKPGCFADEPFLCGAAVHLKRDIIIIHLHPATIANGLFNWVRGGKFGSDQSAPGCPIFLGNYSNTQGIIQGVPKNASYGEV